ncbi:transglutaminase-like domain-containing protein [Thermococcus sp. 2319x1]|uniref:transglutaminase-like domain-containing protein n=1 Tax=Thermococcus sp. 2319x1 TaxID=1674923 RepID=UPI0015834EFA|nr:transglutaminase-like domain-containing protein [Thermococcus sp. 2319x1]
MYRILNEMKSMFSKMADVIKNLDKRQYLPSEKDIEHKDIKELSNILKEDSEVKTLTNILEWQERNIIYWAERAYMHLLLGMIAMISVWFLPKLEPQIKVILTLLVLVVLSLGNIYFYLPTQIILLGWLLFVLWSLYRINPLVGMQVVSLEYVMGLSAILGGIISPIVYLWLKYRTIKYYIPNFKLSDTFETSLSVEKILKYRLAVCRDYAKLTAALLFNLYPKNEIYFIEIPSHVATGIKIGNKIYVLDQRLPITSLERWIGYWRSRLNKKSLNVIILKAFYQEGRIKIEEVDKREVKNLSIPIVDVNSLNKRLLEELGIEKMTVSNKVEKIKSIRLKDMALKYENDEIVEYSMVRAFKNKILNEFCGDIKKITKIAVQQDGKDIVLNIFYF